MAPKGAEGIFQQAASEQPSTQAKEAESFDVMLTVNSTSKME
jgi:hypothetical protein